MLEPSDTSEAVETITLDEARELLHALELLKTIADRSTEAAYTATTHVTYPRTARAQDYGRLTAVAGVAADAIFNAVLTAANYCEEPAANQAIDERHASRTSSAVPS